MKLNPIGWLLRRSAPKAPVLLAVTPPRTGERTLLGVENLLRTIAVPEPFSLELAGDADGVTLMARCQDKEVVQGQIATHYPQARIAEVVPEEDPLRLAEDEEAWGMTLSVKGPSYVPLRTFRDDDLLDPGSDPLLSILGAMANLRAGERMAARMVLRSLGPDWSQHYQEKALAKPVTERRDPSYTYQTRPLQTDGVTMAILGVAALAALRGYLWIQAGETWKTVLMGAGIVAALTVVGWGWWRWKKARRRVYDPLLIKEKVSRLAFDAHLQVTVILPKGDKGERAKALLEAAASAYRHYDNPAGARFKVDKMQRVIPTPSFHVPGPGLFGSRSVLGVREVASLWHTPWEPGTRLPWWPARAPRRSFPRAGECGMAPTSATT